MHENFIQITYLLSYSYEIALIVWQTKRERERWENFVSFFGRESDNFTFHFSHESPYINSNPSLSPSDAPSIIDYYSLVATVVWWQSPPPPSFFRPFFLWCSPSPCLIPATLSAKPSSPFLLNHHLPLKISSTITVISITFLAPASTIPPPPPPPPPPFVLPLSPPSQLPPSFAYLHYNLCVHCQKFYLIVCIT